jgi:protein-L-isoaspartate(D-aspartate) O-methyltransferase
MLTSLAYQSLQRLHEHYSELYHRGTIFDEQRAELVTQLHSKGITDERILNVMGRIPREQFVHAGFMHGAYHDMALPIGSGQTISQPYIVALMTSLLQLNPDEHPSVLEVGTGSGYQAAVLALLGARVWTIERIPELYFTAQKTLEHLGIHVSMRLGDGSLGWSEAAPFDGIIVTAGAPDVPQTLVEQLAIGGIMVIPVGSYERQRLYRITRISEHTFDVQESQGARFVPLVGQQAWEQ